MKKNWEAIIVQENGLDINVGQIKMFCDVLNRTINRYSKTIGRFDTYVGLFMHVELSFFLFCFIIVYNKRN